MVLGGGSMPSGINIASYRKLSSNGYSCFLFSVSYSPCATSQINASVFLLYSSIIQIIQQQKLIRNAKFNKKDKFNKYAIDNSRNVKYTTYTRFNKNAK